MGPAFALVGEAEATQDPNFDMKFYATTGTGAPTSGSNYRIDYNFKLPNLKFDASKPAVFRWVWFCGYDAQCDCTPANGQWMHPNVTSGATCPANDYVGYGLGEIFVNCADITRVSGGSGPGPNPTTDAPVTTEAPVTTQAPVTEAPVTTQEPHPCPGHTTSTPETAAAATTSAPETSAPETTAAPETTSAATTSAP